MEGGFKAAQRAARHKLDLEDGPQEITRPFTDIWAKRAEGWRLIARQATIADAR